MEKREGVFFTLMTILGVLAGFAWIAGIVISVKYHTSPAFSLPIQTIGALLVFLSPILALVAAIIIFKQYLDKYIGCISAIAFIFPPFMIIFGLYLLCMTIMALPQSIRNVLFFMGLAVTPVWYILLVIYVSQKSFILNTIILILFGLGVVPIALLLFGISFLRKKSQRTILVSIIPIGLVLCASFYMIAIHEDNRRCNNLQAGANLNTCSFANKSLAGLQLEGASFNQADLTGANLTGANLAKASFLDANLHSANLTQANLAGASMPGADISGTTGLTNEMLGSLGDWHGLMLEPIENMISVLGGVCLGKPIPTAATYDASLDLFHPLYLMDVSGSKSEWTSALPRRWWPSRLTLAELVACAGKTIEYDAYSCAYDDGSTITLKGYQVEIKLIAAQTGKIIEKVWADGETASCPNQTTGGGSIEGSSITAGDILNALQKYVNPTGRMEPLTIP